MEKQRLESLVPCSPGSCAALFVPNPWLQRTCIFRRLTALTYRFVVASAGLDCDSLVSLGFARQSEILLRRVPELEAENHALRQELNGTFGCNTLLPWEWSRGETIRKIHEVLKCLSNSAMLILV